MVTSSANYLKYQRFCLITHDLSLFVFHLQSIHLNSYPCARLDIEVNNFSLIR
jgi:hypothetical protein